MTFNWRKIIHFISGAATPALVVLIHTLSTDAGSSIHWAWAVPILSVAAGWLAAKGK